MQMDIHAQPFKLTSALEMHVNQRVSHAIGTASKAVRGVRGVMVRLSNVNGAVDKKCRIVVWLRHVGAVVVEAVDRDLYTAIDAASAKLRVALGRQLARRRTLRRETPKRLRVYPFDDLQSQLPAWSY